MLKCVKYCLKPKNGCLKIQTKHPLCNSIVIFSKYIVMLIFFLVGIIVIDYNQVCSQTLFNLNWQVVTI